MLNISKFLSLFVLSFLFLYNNSYSGADFSGTNYSNFQRGDSPNWITAQSINALAIQKQMGDILQFAPLVIALGFVLYEQDSNIFKLIKKEKTMKELIDSPMQSYKDDGLLQLALGTGAALGTMGIFKIAVGRPRPAQYERGEQNGLSFFSGHTTIAFSPSFFVAMRYGWLKAIPSLLISTFVGYTRVAVKAHYVTDVVAAGLVSFLYSWLFTFKYEYKGVQVALTPPIRAQYGIGVQVYW